MPWSIDTRFVAVATRTTRAKRTILTIGIALAISACETDYPQKTLVTDNLPAVNPALSAADPTTTPVYAQLAGDALIAPAQPVLAIKAETGVLHLEWQPLDNQSQASLYHYDSQTRQETLIRQFNDDSIRSLSLPSQTHLRAWHREFFRVELCTAEDCVSSQRMSITGLAEPTTQTLSPAVFVEAEKFADDAVLNENATLLVTTLPVEGALQLYLRPDSQWIAGQRIRLDALSPSQDRTLQVALSASGDTLAVAVRGIENDTGTELRILERLGEAWIETSRSSLEVPQDSKSTDNSTVGTSVPSERALLLSASGDQLLITLAGRVYHYRYLATGWSSPQPLINQDHSRLSTPNSERFAQNSVNLAMAASADMQTVFTVDSLDEVLWVSLWQPQDEVSDSTSWHKAAAYRLDELDPAQEVLIESHSNGNQIALAGWERYGGPSRTPVMWRYTLPDPEQALVNSSLDVDIPLTATDSLRLTPASQVSDKLRFDADNQLMQIVLGWQGPVDSTSPSDAALSTYRFDDEQRRWISQLELPETMPTLAKQAFVDLVRLSGDGSTMIYVSAEGQSLSGNNRVGELISMH